MQTKKVITDSMDSKEIIALLDEDFAFGQHKYDETYKHYEKLAKGYDDHGTLSTHQNRPYRVKRNNELKT